MTAQYRPYRDEDSVDGLEATSWSENEPSTIQIYEKTTEELPFNSMSKRTFWTQVVLIIFVGTLGFLLGYFAPFHRAIAILDAEPESFKHSEFNSLHEDYTIKDKILNKIDGHKILEILTKYQDTNRIPGSETDHAFARHIQELFNDYEFDRVTSTNHTFETRLPAKPSIVSLLNKDEKILFSNIEDEIYPHEDMRPILPLSQANETIITTDQIIYVNKGSKEDYLKLNSLGIGSALATELKGKVIVIRQTFYQAHDVVINAQEKGAIAVLLFPDPETYGVNSPFPKEVRLPNDAGKSHPTAWSNYGDLVTFNVSSLVGFDTSKLGFEKESEVSIPVIPISFNTAKKILRGLSGTLSPNEWNCFDFTLYLGPGYREENSEDMRSKIKIEFYNKETSITSATVTGIVIGSTEADRYIVLGSRRDSLNRGLLDSVSGTAVMLEIARVFGNLIKNGWHPRRTIVFNSFGAESLNLIGSSRWLEINQRLLHSRAVAYINCDQIITGNHSAAVAASPLLYQVLFNATKQVDDPNSIDHNHRSVYETWKQTHHMTKKYEIEGGRLVDPDLEHIFEQYDVPEFKLTKNALDTHEDGFGQPGSILREYKDSATVKVRPKLRRLDLQSVYSPFFLYAGIPVVDVRFAGFATGNTSSQLLEDTIPLLGTKYDNLATIQHIDPHLRYHVAVAQILSEILRDLSDSIFLPFNLIDYAVTLKDSYQSFAGQYGKTFNSPYIELESLKQIVTEFAKSSINFHHRQDLINLKDSLGVRKINDQLMLLERAFLDPNGIPNHSERKHIILTPNEGHDQKEGFPGLVDWITVLEGDNLDAVDYPIYLEILKVHYKTVVHMISNAIRIIEEVHIL